MRSILCFLALNVALGADAFAADARPISPVAGHGGKIKVFLLAGQSNMEGKGDGGRLTDMEKAELEKAQKQIRLAYNREPVGPLRLTVASAGIKKKFGVDFTFGPELFFGLRLAAAWPDEQILLIKRSVGATSLYGRWSPDWTTEKAKQMGEEKAPPLYRDFIGYVREILAGYDRNAYEVCGMLWVQGEADGNPARGPDPAETYGRNLSNLITRVRSDLGMPDLPFLMVQVGAGKVEAGMKATAAALPRVAFIPQSTDPASPNYFPKYEVGHYNYEGMKRIGNRFAEIYLRTYAAGGGRR